MCWHEWMEVGGMKQHVHFALVNNTNTSAVSKKTKGSKMVRSNIKIQFQQGNTDVTKNFGGATR